MTRMIAVAAAAWLLLLAGCGPKQMLANERLRTEAMTVIASDPVMSTEMVNRLMMSDTTRKIMVDQIMANGEARQDFLLQAARDRTMIEGMLNVAVQDSTMRSHVMTLLRGMQMAGLR